MFLAFPIKAQYIIDGRVTDPENQVLTGAVILLNEGGQTKLSNSMGQFTFEDLEEGIYTLEVRFVGFTPYRMEFNLVGDTSLVVSLTKAVKELEEVVVKDNFARARERTEPIAIEVVEENYLLSHRSGSLIQTLDRLPGIKSMGIGSSQSKPLIRGLGFQRVVVAENGIKHEGQQWGMDHGLEIDQFGASHVEVIRGPASILYGSDAIGGVINIRDLFIPKKLTLGGKIESGLQTNNDLYAISASLYGRKENLYAKLRFTLSDYADQKIPADSIAYYSRYFRLKDKRLRNTAGNERNLGITLGYDANKWKSSITLSSVTLKSGFFANAHGLEIRRSRIDYDRSFRDMDLPYQQVNHLKMLINSTLELSRGQFIIDAGWQRNYRKEFSEAIGHGYMPDPPDNLEREFIRDGLEIHSGWIYTNSSGSRIQAGLNLSARQNRIGGWGYIIPAYRSSDLGIYFINRWNAGRRTQITAALRYDMGKIDTEQYTDWFPTAIDQGNGDPSDVYIQRAPDLTREFGAFTGSLGLVNQKDNFVFKFNLGRSFRFPNAKELASEGINYHWYRYEIGDASLQPETAWQTDFEFRWNYPEWALQINPFAGYFPNFIFLSPGYEFREGMQVFRYQQNQIFRTGGEIHFHYSLTNRIEAGFMAEYTFARQITGDKKGFGIPFTPPLSTILNLKYLSKNRWRFSDTYFMLDLKMVASQKEIVPPEQFTPGFYIVNLGLNSDVRVFQDPWSISLRIENLFNRSYLDHTSYYRIVGIPESGRFFSIRLRIPFELDLSR